MTEEARPIDACRCRARRRSERAEDAAVGAASFVLSLRARGIRDIARAAGHGARAARGLRPAPLRRPRPHRRRPAARLRPDHDGAGHRRRHARGPRRRAGPAGARDRHRQRLRDGASGAARRPRWSRSSASHAGESAAQHLRVVGALGRSASRSATASRRGCASASTASSSTVRSPRSPTRLTALLAPGGRLVGGLLRRRHAAARAHRARRRSGELPRASSGRSACALSPLVAGRRDGALAGSRKISRQSLRQCRGRGNVA